jgi:hypothetical protein
MEKKATVIAEYIDDIAHSIMQIGLCSGITSGVFQVISNNCLTKG